MRILYYNWTPLNVHYIGGGVAVYINNLISSDIASLGGVTVLTSGYFYDKTRKPYIRKQIETTKYESYELVNSPAPAPLGIVPPVVLDRIMKDTQCKDIIDKFIEEHGPFDVIHFQTLEGISPNVLSLKKKYPQIAFIHSIHDYGLFCPNVKFWRVEKQNCVTAELQENCRQCMLYAENIPLHHYLIYREKAESKYSNFLFRIQRKLNSLVKSTLIKKSTVERYNDIYHSFRLFCVENINKYIDMELAVSQRVKEISIKYGIRPEKLNVSYIGTKVAGNALGHSVYPFDGKKLTLLFMGYASTAKGFNFLIDALDCCDVNIAANVTLKFASKMSTSSRNMLKRLRGKYKDIIIYDGYSHSDFPKIFKDVNLGVIPPMWEDNLPQVAIEMIANGVPVITSNNGGAKELNKHPQFVFYNKSDFISKFENIFRNPSILIDYWNYSSNLTTLDDHIKQLKEIYSLCKTNTIIL